LGKTIGKDKKSGKATFVTVFGLTEAERLFREEISAANRALDDLRNLGYNTDLIAEFTDDLSEREK
jgi:geranylgeranyl pyrophosphate synthase